MLLFFSLAHIQAFFIINQFLLNLSLLQFIIFVKLTIFKFVKILIYLGKVYLKSGN
jgi:hypothetical protein